MTKSRCFLRNYLATFMLLRKMAWCISMARRLQKFWGTKMSLSCPQLSGSDGFSVRDCYIPEHSVCHLVHNSKSPDARIFELWLFNCVIPLLRADTIRCVAREGLR